MDILEDINAENKYWNTIAWFKRLCIVVSLITICAAFFIYYKGVLNKRHETQDIEITDQLILNTLNKAAEQSKLVHKRPALEILHLSKIHSLIREKNRIDALQKLDDLIIQTNASASEIGAVARILWMSIALNMDDLDKEKFCTYASYFTQNPERIRLFEGRANILNAIFSLKIGQTSKAKEILSEVLHSQHCSSNIREEAKAVLASIK